MIKYLLLLLLAAPSAHAQSTNNKAAARKIDRIVKEIQADTSLSRVSKADVVFQSPKIIGFRQQDAISYFRNGILVRYHIWHFDGPYLSGFSRDYYFQDGKLIYLHEEMSNSSRMGSCGTVTVKYDYYLRENEMIFFRRGQLQDFYETCYGDMGPKDALGIGEAWKMDSSEIK